MIGDTGVPSDEGFRSGERMSDERAGTQSRSMFLHNREGTAREQHMQAFPGKDLNVTALVIVRRGHRMRRIVQQPFDQLLHSQLP